MVIYTTCTGLPHPKWHLCGSAQLLRSALKLQNLTGTQSQQAQSEKCGSFQCENKLSKNSSLAWERDDWE